MAQNYGSTGDNLMGSLMGTGSGVPVDYGDPWRNYMSGGGAKAEGGDTRHMDQLDAVHQQQLAAAGAYYEGATAPSNIQAGMMRGQALQGSLGGLAGGGLEARQAIYGAGAGSYGAGLQGTQMGSEARLGAADAWMNAQSDRARYDMALAQAFQQRDAAAAARDRQIEEAVAARKAGELSGAKQAMGSILGSGGSMIGAMGNSSGTGGGGGGGGGPADEQGGGYGAAKYA